MATGETDSAPRPSAHSPLEPFAGVSLANLPTLPQFITQLGSFGSLSDQPLRFSLHELFVVMTATGVVFGLFRALGIWGALLAFVATVVLTFAIIPRLYRENASRQCLLFDAVWGIVFPLICLVFDPFVFKQGPDPFLAPLLELDAAPAAQFTRVNPLGWLLYPLLAWQMFLLGWCVVCGPGKGHAAAWKAGSLYTGQVLALIVGGCLFPIAALGTFALGLGLLGFTPWLTAAAFYHQARRAHVLAGDVRHRQLAMLLGGCLSLVLTVIPSWLLIVLLQH